MDERLVPALIDACDAVGVPLTPSQLASCARYAERIVETNAQMNLTRIVEPEAMAVKHFADSLTVLAALPDLPPGARVADVGTGAGFPGLVLKIARPDLVVTLIDSLRKRLLFLEDIVRELELGDVTLVHARAEDAGKDARYRAQHDLVTARAVAALPRLVTWCAPLVRPGGRFVAMKGGEVDDEVIAAVPAARLVGLKLVHQRFVVLPALAITPGGEEIEARRTLVIYERGLSAPPTRTRIRRRL
jgi:16S rRNA (guanine527-N7)-methyltransferase